MTARGGKRATRTEPGVRPPGRVPVDGDQVPLVAPLGQLPLQLLPRQLLPLQHPLLVVRDWPNPSVFWLLYS